MSLLIRNVKLAGTLEGSPEKGDLYVSGAKISALGDLKGKRAEETIDGQGAWLAPGFIDVESLADMPGTWKEGRTPALFDPARSGAMLLEGTTTVIGGHCGATFAAITERGFDMRRALKARNLAVNFLSLAPDAGMAKDIDSVHMDEGSLESKYSAAAKRRKIFLPHVLSPRARAKDAESILGSLERMSANTDVRTAVALFAYKLRDLKEFLPAHLREKSFKELAKLFADEWTPGKILKELPLVHPENLIVLQAPENPMLTLVSLKEFMAHRELEDPREGMLALMRATACRATVLESGGYPRMAIRLLADPRVFLGSHTPHPVSSVNAFLKALRGLLRIGWTFPQAISKVTAEPAGFFGIHDRGILKEGLAADLVLLNNSGEVRTVVVNGVVAVRDGVLTGRSAGQLLRSSS